MPSLVSALIAAIATSIATTQAHMILSSPVPYGLSTLTNSPIDVAANDFPCKQRPGVYDAAGVNNVMPQGSTQTLSFIGSAVHGGGSCQISLTSDLNPNMNSDFRVIHSIEGGCPARNMNNQNYENYTAGVPFHDPNTYTYTMPSDVPAGKYTLAWTWFNKVGNREMYMNCAPVTVTGKSSKRSEISNEKFEGLDKRATANPPALKNLPQMFVANINIGPCKTPDSTEIKFPDPGQSVERNGDASKLTAPNCGASGGAPQSPAAPAAPAAPATPAALSISVPPSLPSSSASVSSPVASASPVPADPAPAPSASGSTAPSSGSSGGLSGPCTTEGEFNCVGGSSFQQCASGAWSVVQPMAPGTKCTAGESASLNMSASSKRSVRFSPSHLRRHWSHQGFKRVIGR